jgi:predicted amidohydrolase YtcJ
MSRPLLIRNGRIRTMDPGGQAAASVLMDSGRILSVGGEREHVKRARELKADEIDLRGRTLVPAFIDAHIHLLAYAARLISVDCGPRAVASIADVKRVIGDRAASLAPGTWVRAAGYDELALAEKRHPTRHELDKAAPHNPVRLLHRSGHACVLNSRALALAGIGGETPEPRGGFMERDLRTGEPTGLLVEMNDLVDRAVPPIEAGELRTAMRAAGDRLLANGVTFVQDASATNGIEEWRLVDGYIESGALSLGVSMMEGFEHIGELPETAAGGRLRRGPVKIMPRELENEVHPGPSELAAMLASVEAAGRTAAVHAVTRRGIETAIQAFASLGERARGHRIEHCGICSESQADRIAGLGVRVVTQPGFIYANGDLIGARLGESDLPDLYPLLRLLGAGVAVAGSSDAPVVEPDPIAGIRGAVTRRSLSGCPLAPEQALGGPEALRLFTSSAAEVLGLGHERGTIRPGMAADLVVLSQDPAAADVDWPSVRVEMTFRAGELVWDAFNHKV